MGCRPANRVRLGVGISLMAMAALTPTALASHAAAASVPAADGPTPSAVRDVRPGPDILYAPLATTPLLDNHGIWKAEPIMVSGASAYRRGEFLYQDYLYDDHGANGNGDLSANGPTPGLGAASWGSYTYPTDPTYGGNAADLVEVRVKPLPTELAVRLTFNTMIDPSVVATTIGLGDSPVAVPMPHGANAQQRAKVFVTVHGGVADAVDAMTGQTLGTPDVAVDLDRHQIDVRVPRTVIDPQGLFRVTAATGLWDSAVGAYRTPQGSADAQRPGGAGVLSNPPAFFNVAFRYDEPRRAPFPVTSGWGNVQASWRDYDQANALASGDLSRFAATIDLTKLASGIDDDMPDQHGGVPQSGYLNRIYVTHFPAGQGIGTAASLQPEQCATPCAPTIAGPLVPYAVYVPPTPPPATGYAMTLLLHGCSDNHNTFLAFNLADLLSRRSGGSIVATPGGRGPCYWYYGQGGADPFEMWADIAAHYPLDPANAVVAGYSMGGYGTYKLGSQFPDLFRAASPLYGCVSAGTIWAGDAQGEPPGGDASWAGHGLPALRHVEIQPWNGGLDPICTYTAQQQLVDELDALGYRYVARTTTDSHAILAGNDAFAGVMADFFDHTTLARDPAHVTYVFNSEMDEPRFGMNADHAYWLSGLTLADPAAGTQGTIDVVSHGFGVGDPEPQPTQYSAGALTGGALAPVVAYEQQSKTWGPVPAAPTADVLEITASDIATVTIDAVRARVSCNAEIRVHTDHPLAVTLSGCGPAQQFG